MPSFNSVDKMVPQGMVYIIPCDARGMPYVPDNYDGQGSAGNMLPVQAFIDPSDVVNVNVVSSGGAITYNSNNVTNPTVTNASTTILAANALRANFRIQNQDATGIIYLNFGNPAVAGAGSVRIMPGGFYEPPIAGYVGDVQAIGSIASNPNVTIEEVF